MADSPFTNEDLETISRTWNSNKYTEHTAMVLAKELLQARAALSHAAGQDGEKCRAASVTNDVDIVVQQLEERAKWFREENGQDATLLRQCAALLRALSRGVPEGMVLVPKAEFGRALALIKVPKMSPLKQELFKAGTHAVIRAFNDVLNTAIAAQRKDG